MYKPFLQSVCLMAWMHEPVARRSERTWQRECKGVCYQRLHLQAGTLTKPAEC